MIRALKLRKESSPPTARRFFQGGFTLLEVLIAITITGLIGVGTYQLFNSTLKTQETMERRSAELEKLQRAMALLGRDFQQLAARQARNGYGDPEYAISNRNNLYLIEATHYGWRNPLGDARSELQRVSYELREDKFYRNFYRVLDRAQDSNPLDQELLTDVESVSFRFMDAQNQWHEEWPTDAVMNQGGPDQFTVLPKAVEVQINHKVFGILSRLFDVAGYKQ